MANNTFAAFQNAVEEYEKLKDAGFPAVISYIIHPVLGYIFSVDVGPRWEVYPRIRRADVARLCRESGGKWIELEGMDIPSRSECRYVRAKTIRPGHIYIEKVQMLDELGRLIEQKLVVRQEGGSYILAHFNAPGVGILDSEWAAAYVTGRSRISVELAEKVLLHVRKYGLWKKKKGGINWFISLLGFDPENRDVLRTELWREIKKEIAVSRKEDGAA